MKAIGLVLQLPLEQPHAPVPVPGAGRRAGNLAVGGNSLSVGSLCSSGFDSNGLSCVRVNSCGQLGIGQVLGTWQGVLTGNRC